eukprot:5384389-Pleurochrysis_carterae.AAC.1
MNYEGTTLSKLVCSCRTSASTPLHAASTVCLFFFHLERVLIVIAARQTKAQSRRVYACRSKGA